MDLKKVKRQDDGWNWDDEAIELLERVRDSMDALEERIQAQKAIIDYAKVSGLMSTADSNLWDEVVTRIGPLMTDFGTVMANPRVASAITILRNTVSHSDLCSIINSVSVALANESVPVGAGICGLEICVWGLLWMVIPGTASG